ncbi:unnamed protein product, partial [Meganyctiphanes norvegica]
DRGEHLPRAAAVRTEETMTLPAQWLCCLLLTLTCCSVESAQSMFSTHRNLVVSSSYETLIVKTNCACKRHCITSLDCIAASVAPREDGNLDCSLANDSSIDTSSLDPEPDTMTFIK